MSVQSITLVHPNSMAYGDRKKASKIKTEKIGRVSLNFIVAILIGILGVLYIFEVNINATQGYEYRKLEKSVNELKDKNDGLKVREAQLRSMRNIEQKANELNMTAPKDVSYISLPGNVAMNDSVSKSQ